MTFLVCFIIIGAIVDVLVGLGAWAALRGTREVRRRLEMDRAEVEVQRQGLGRDRDAIRVLAEQLRANPDLDLAPTDAMLEALRARRGKNSPIVYVWLIPTGRVLEGRPEFKFEVRWTANICDAAEVLRGAREVVLSMKGRKP